MPALVQSRIIVFDPHGEYAKDLGSSNGVTIIDAGSIPEFGCRLVRDADELEAVLDMKMERTARTIVDQAIRQAKGDRQAFLAYLKDHAVRHAEGESFDPEEFAAVRDDIKTNITAFFKTLQDTADKVVNAERQADLMDAANSDEATKRTKQIKQEIEAEIVERVDRWFGGLPQATKDHLTDKITRSVFFKNVETYFGDEVVLIAPAVLEAIEEVIDTINLKPLDLVSRMQKPGVYIINLQKIHEEEVRHDLAHSILRQVFEAKKSDPEKEMDSLFVVEEAHNFAPEGASKNNPASRMLKKIASEGRKFRLGLLVVTQRPAYVSKDVLSQCSTQFVFRLINPNDIKAVAETVEGISEAQLKELPGFETGQAIFTGVAVQSSVMVRVK
jgi:DNA helicase HerA-like ATPase